MHTTSTPGMAERQRSRMWMGYAACALAGCLWGTGFYFGKLALREMSVGHMVLYRFLFASLGMLPIWLQSRLSWPSLRGPGMSKEKQRQPRWTNRQRTTILAASTLGIPLQFLLQFEGLARTTVSHASLMVGTMPVLLALGATLFAGERLDGIGWLALAGSTLGASLIVLGGTAGNAIGHAAGHAARHAAGRATGHAIGNAAASGLSGLSGLTGLSGLPGLSGLSAHAAFSQPPGPALGPTLGGDLLVVLSLVIALGWILMNKSLMQVHSPLAVTAYGIFSGTAMLLVWVFAVDGPPPVARVSWTAWMALAASGVLCTATTTLLWNWGIHHVPASRAGVFLNIEPALGSLLGVELLGDKLGPYAWLGGGLILAAAITLTARGAKDEKTLTPEVMLE